MDFLVVTDPRKESYSEKRLSPKMRMYSVSRATLAHLQSSVFKLSKDLIDSIHEEGIVAYTS